MYRVLNPIAIEDAVKQMIILGDLNQSNILSLGKQVSAGKIN